MSLTIKADSYIIHEADFFIAYFSYISEGGKIQYFALKYYNTHS